MVDNIFNAQECGGVFAVCPDEGGTQAALVFVRAVSSQNSFGEVILSFASALTVEGDLQPAGGNYPRMIHGTLEQVNFDFIVFGNPDIRVGDRTTISAAAVEIINIDRFGTEQTEAQMKYVR